VQENPYPKDIVMASVRRSQQALEKYRKVGLTREGENWLIQAVDPYHDLPIDPTGHPDGIVARSVIQFVKKQVTITKDSALPAGNWDLSMYLDPALNPHNYGWGTFYDGGKSLSAASGSLSNLGGINMLQVGSGTDADWTLSTPGLPRKFSSLPIPNSYFDGAFRVLSVGFEVTDTTADLYKQGAVTTWRLPTSVGARQTSLNYISGNTVYGGSLDTEIYPLPPKNPAEATTLTTSDTWEAREGCYIVGALDDVDNPVERLSERLFIMTNDYFGSITGVIPDAGGNWFGGALQAVGTRAIAGCPSVARHRFSPCGAYFSGLHESASLVLTFHVFIERFPNLSQSDLVVMARPAPRRDPIALEIYSQIMSEMPVGVMVKENGLGDWFAEAVSAIAPVISGGLSMLPHPAAKAASVVAGMAGKAADHYIAGTNKTSAAALKQKRKDAKKRAKTAAAKKKPPKPPSRKGRPPLPQRN